MNSQLQLMNESTTNTNVVDNLSDVLYATETLATGETEFYPFSKRYGDAGESYGTTNVELGNQVPAKQSWLIHGFKVSIFSATALDASSVATLIDTLSKTDLFFEVDNSPKIHIPLTEVMGLSSGVVTADATNNVSTNLQNMFSGAFKFKSNAFALGPQTSFAMRLKLHDANGIPVALNGLKIRVSMIRDYKRLV